MSRFRNTATGVVVSVDDSKDSRFGAEWKRLDESATPRRGRPPKPKPE